MSRILHETPMGQYVQGDTLELLTGSFGDSLRGNVQLVFTSPPFPLNKKKSYGNLAGEAYKDWFVGLAHVLSDLLTPDGSIVIELGNSWEPGRPVQSLLPLECLLGFVNAAGADLRLCQEFVCYNPSRLPSPAQWVTKNRIRTTDSFTHLWWIAKTDYPKADTAKVLRPYSERMKALLRRGRYNSGRRPSQHGIGETSFLVDHGGSIPQNVFEIEPIDPSSKPRLPNAFSFSNTSSNDHYHRACREQGITPHPARMHEGLAAFFIEFLTDANDLVLDPFGGSNTTGYTSEKLGRRWCAIDAKEAYAEHSRIRFQDPSLIQMAPAR